VATIGVYLEKGILFSMDDKWLEITEPNEEDSIDCHLQQIGMGSLICRAAKQTGQEGITNKVTPAICFSCDVGNIFREVGCDAATPDITIHSQRFGPAVNMRNIFCQLRRRDTTIDYCRKCTLATAESTRQIVSTARGLFQSLGFYAAYQDLEKARLDIRDGKFDSAITHSIACLESTCRIIHEEKGLELPKSKDLTTLWKSTRAVLDLDTLLVDGDSVVPLLNSLHGVITNVASIRNALSDAHGKGKLAPNVSEAIAELALNTASAAATFLIRHYKRQNDENT